jgi:F-type H+-transporting ATPase subunit delta
VPASASARRYATAAMQVARQSGDFDTWLNGLAEFSRILQMPSARVIFTSPAIPAAQKRAALGRLLPNLPPLVRNFLYILADRDRLGQVPDIRQAMIERVNEQRGVITADVTTAIPLDADLERTVAQRLGAYLKHDPARITIRTRVDPSIIGGVVARVGDTLIDDSVRGRIQRLRRTLARTR